eukprot:scaffold23097_cov51-Skeletonema_menzelii.AAC.1
MEASLLSVEIYTVSSSAPPRILPKFLPKLVKISQMMLSDVPFSATVSLLAKCHQMKSSSSVPIVAWGSAMHVRLAIRLQAIH